MEQKVPFDSIKFKCSIHPGQDIVSVMISENINASKRLCCNKCMLYIYRGYSTDQFILLEDIFQGNDQATAYFLPISKTEQELVQDAIIESLNNGYVSVVEDFFADLQKKVNNKIEEKKKETILLAQEKQRLLEDLRESFTKSEQFKEFQNIFINSHQNKLETNDISKNVHLFLQNHKKHIELMQNQQQIIVNENNQNNNQNGNENNENNQNQEQPNQENNQMQVIDQYSSDLDFQTKFKNFRKKDFTIKTGHFEIYISPLFLININFVKYNSCELVLQKNQDGQPTVFNKGGQTATCKSDYVLEQQKTYLFTFEFSDKPSDYMRIGISKKDEDPDDKHCQCFGWLNNFDLEILKGENLSNKISPKSQVKMEVNIQQNKLQFYDPEKNNVAQKKNKYTLDPQAQYTIVMYFHSDLKSPITLTLLSSEILY